MIRRIIQIDEEKCNGCSACARACHEGAIAMVEGKARLMREDYCDGLGDCLPACPTGAIRKGSEAKKARRSLKTAGFSLFHIFFDGRLQHGDHLVHVLLSDHEGRKETDHIVFRGD